MRRWGSCSCCKGPEENNTEDVSLSQISWLLRTQFPKRDGNRYEKLRKWQSWGLFTFYSECDRRRRTRSIRLNRFSIKHQKNNQNHPNITSLPALNSTLQGEKMPRFQDIQDDAIPAAPLFDNRDFAEISGGNLVSFSTYSEYFRAFITLQHILTLPSTNDWNGDV